MGALKSKLHLVPLPDQAIEIIRSMPRAGKYVFPSIMPRCISRFGQTRLLGPSSELASIHDARLPHELPQLGRR